MYMALMSNDELWDISPRLREKSTYSFSLCLLQNLPPHPTDTELIKIVVLKGEMTSFLLVCDFH